MTSGLVPNTGNPSKISVSRLYPNIPPACVMVTTSWPLFEFVAQVKLGSPRIVNHDVKGLSTKKELVVLPKGPHCWEIADIALLLPNRNPTFTDPADGTPPQ